MAATGKNWWNELADIVNVSMFFNAVGHEFCGSQRRHAAKASRQLRGLGFQTTNFAVIANS